MVAVMESLVANPETLTVEILTEGAVNVIKVSGRAQQVACLIGKQGRNARAIRTLLNAIAHPTGDKIMLDITPGDIKSEIP